ncbi:MAG: tRNA (adenosine(37)-N6)-threonylcarbamoyltransferase complex dimerization subunit type 1 TsaB [Bacteroidales bacterium]|nr:tRNA (adenosine(37)-N6)-threonylcarbamoyltransferase complex dimerization subunit type 1 TsaB [Bacteroidales bacterium]
MPVILHIETATRNCSVALSRDSECLFSKLSQEGPSHASRLGVFVDEALQFAKFNDIQLDAVAVSCGPGSYTGLRIGVSMAKGLCYALGIPLIFVPTLRVLMQALKDKTDAYICPMIDARRMEVYTQMYDAQGNELSPVQAMIVDENSFSDLPENQAVIICGDGAAKCLPVIKKENLQYEEVILQASLMITPALEAYQQESFEDVAYSEPFYLKEFQATIPTKLQQIIKA